MPVPSTAWSRSIIRPYVQMARPDHWFKNAFMFFGVLLAWINSPATLSIASTGWIALAVFCTCLIASSNYVLNEYLDAPMDREHPTKWNRPAALGLVHFWGALGLWASLACIGLLLALQINTSFAASALMLWIMGCIYNIPPIRTKDVPYLDVLSESVNNPLRLLLGWFVLQPNVFPSLSLILSYWMAGGFFMATKRFAEYRRIADKPTAARYRASFRHYDEEKLLMTMAFYLVTGAVFAGAFIVRFKLELIFIVPIAAALFAYYTKLGMRADSPVQAPEKLYKEPIFMLLAISFVVGFALLAVTDIPFLYEFFAVEPSGIEPLWTIGR